MDSSSSYSSSPCTAIVPAAPTIQIVTKASSDELLRKFADSNNDAKKKKTTVAYFVENKRRSVRRESGDLPIERKCLLPPATHAARRSSSSRKLGMGRRAFKSKSIVAGVRKMVTRSVERASRVFMEKQCNRHKRLINDAPTITLSSLYPATESN